MNECPFCTKRFTTTKRLTGHLMAKHKGVQVSGQTLLVYRTSSWFTVRCWCGERFAHRRPRGLARLAESFAHHLDFHGGLHAHLLAITLQLQGNPQTKRDSTWMESTIITPKPTL